MDEAGLTPSETTLTLQNVNVNNFGQLFQRPVTGDMYPQPLIVSGLSIGGGTHNVVYLRRRPTTVYAYDADDATIIAPYWSVKLGNAGSRDGRGLLLCGYCKRCRHHRHTGD